MAEPTRRRGYTARAALKPWRQGWIRTSLILKGAAVFWISPKSSKAPSSEEFRLLPCLDAGPNGAQRLHG